MTKAEVISSLATGGAVTQDQAKGIVEDFISMALNSIENSGRFHWPGFGTFTIRHRKSRSIRNPQTNAIMILPETKTIGFRPARAVIESLRG